MKKFKKISFVFMIIFALIAMAGVATDHNLRGADSIDAARIAASPQFNGEVFKNKLAVPEMSLDKIIPILKQGIFEKQEPAIPMKPIPVVPISKQALESLSADETFFFKLGHSSILISLEGELWLFDPMFSERASPFDSLGPKRFHAPPISIDNLPAIKGVIFSHNHYDHLDRESVEKLKNKVENFYMPLGIGADLVKWGVDQTKIHELDWHESVQVGDVKVTATPSRHFSGRSLSDRNETLWASWVLKSPKHSFYFSGDSGYFPGFKKIGDKYGPFDVSFIETGAYSKLWPEVHMDPKESVQAFKDLKGGVMIPIHNSTFDLSVHTWHDPLDQVLNYAKKEDIKLLTPKMGEKVVLGELPEQTNWWKKLL